MRMNRFLLLCLFTLFGILGLNAQTFRQTIEWKGVQTWTTDKAQGQILEFDGSEMLSANSLPYYVTRIDVNSDFTLEDYEISLKNVRLQPLTDEEKQVVVQLNGDLPPSVAHTAELIDYGHQKQLKIKVVPILKRKSYRKVLAFDVVLQKKSTAAKPARAAAALALYPETLPSAMTQEDEYQYSAQFWVNDATMGSNYEYYISEGDLPQGLWLDSEYGIIMHDYDADGYYLPIVENEDYKEFTIEAYNGNDEQTLYRTYSIKTGCEHHYFGTPQNTALCNNYSGQFVLIDNSTEQPVAGSVFFSLSNEVEGLTMSADGTLAGKITLPQTDVALQAEMTESSCTYTRSFTINNNVVSLTNNELRRGIINMSYEEQLTVTGGTAPFAYTATGLPAGLNLNSVTGKISGTPTESGKFAVAITIADNAGCEQTVDYELTITEGSVMASGNWYKIRIPETGNYTGNYSGNTFNINYVPEQRIYKLTYEQLKAMDGINPDEDIHIFGYGGAMLNEDIAKNNIDDLPELPVHIEKKGEKFGPGDYILFYTQGPVSWTYSGGEYFHTRNPYSNYGYYFVASGLGTETLTAGLAKELPNQPSSSTITTYPVRILHENETSNLINSGRNWYGNKLIKNGTNQNASLFYNINIPDYSNGQVQVRANAVAWNDRASNTTENAIRIYYYSPNPIQPTGAAAQFGTAPVSGSSDYWYVKARELKTPLVGKFSPGNNPDFKVELRYISNNPNSQVSAWVDYLTITTQARLVMNGNQLSFDGTSFSQNSYPLFAIENVSDPATVVWDVTNPNQATQMQVQIQDGQLRFITKMDKQRSFVAFNPKEHSSFPTPENVGRVENQNLQTLKDIDYVIVSPKDFVAEAERLADAHREKNNLQVKVVTPEQVYNEFSSGTPDATAFRRLMKNVYETSSSERANYLLLLGDGEFDNRKLTNNKNLHNYILTFQAENSIHTTDSYLTDDYFGLIRAGKLIGEVDAGIDIGIGRIPVSTAAQARGVVDKIIAYMGNTEKGYWKNQIGFLADDGDNGMHADQAEEVAVLTAQEYPRFQIEKIYLDAYKQEMSGSSESYPDARERLKTLVKNGVMVLDYTGHASPTYWTNEQVMTNDDIQAMNNKKQGLWVAVTCDFARFDDASIFGGTSAGENAVLNPNGGAIGLITATRTVYSTYNLIINRDYMRNMFKKDAQGNPLRLGDVQRLVKQNMTAGNNSRLILNSMNYVLFGDPALTLHYPEYDVVADEFIVNGQLAEGDVMLGALDVVNVKGHIAYDAIPVSDFNGEVQVNLYDQGTIKQTLGNTAGDSRINFLDRNRMITAKGKVENGEFTLTFMLPKGLSQSIESGRMNFYASSENAEAIGMYEEFNFNGEGREVDESDEQGPDLKIYLDTPSFTNGSQVNETPTFFAELFDLNGLNYSGSSSITSIGNDMKIILDNGTEYIVNEYFNGGEDYMHGMVQYTFPPLPAGKHHLKFTARDMLNNSSSATLEFEVVEGLEKFSVKAYPNPARSYAKFGIEYNQPDKVAQFTVNVYDLTGRLLYAATQSTVSNSGYENWTEFPEWYLQSAGGQRLHSGVYLYNAEVTTKSGKTQRSKTQRIIIQ